MRPSLVLALLAAIPAAPAMAQDAPDVRIVEYGEFTAQRDLTPSTKPEGATGVSGFGYAEGIRFVRHATRIEAALCRRFGIYFMAVPPARGTPINVTVRLTHPRLTRPDGVTGTVETWPGAAGLWPTPTMFGFTEPWEVALGTWTFALLEDGRVVAEQAFEVVPPTGSGAPPVEGCEAPTS